MPNHLMTRLRLSLAALFLALCATNALAAVTLTRASGNNLFKDNTGANIYYVAYQVTNDATPRNDVWVKVTATVGAFSLNVNDGGLFHVGPMAAN